MGNPAVSVGTLDRFIAKHRVQIAKRPCYPREGYAAYLHVSEANMQVMRVDLAGGPGYVE